MRRTSPLLHMFVTSTVPLGGGAHLPICLNRATIWYRGQSTVRVIRFMRSSTLSSTCRGGKAKNHSFPATVWFFGLGTPGLQKTLGQQKHCGIPLNISLSWVHCTIEGLLVAAYYPLAELPWQHRKSPTWARTATCVPTTT